MQLEHFLSSGICILLPSARVQPHYDRVRTTYVDVPSSVHALDRKVAGLLYLPIPEIIVWLAGERLGRLIGCSGRGKQLQTSPHYDQ